MHIHNYNCSCSCCQHILGTGNDYVLWEVGWCECLVRQSRTLMAIVMMMMDLTANRLMQCFCLFFAGDFLNARKEREDE